MPEASTPNPTPTQEQVAPFLVEIFGSAPARWTAVTEGGYSMAARWVVEWADGRSAFAKAELDFSDRHGLALEQLAYSQIDAPFLPALLAYSPGDETAPRILVTEDLSAARWGIPLTDAAVDQLGAAIDLMGLQAAPAGFPSEPMPSQWVRLAQRPEVLHESGIADTSWWNRALPVLVEAEAEAGARTAGTQLCHYDLWLQNWCCAERGAVIVDWAGCGAGNTMVSRAWAEAGVRAAGGPGGRVLAPGNTSWAAWMAGQTLHLLTDHRFTPPPRLVATERREAFAALCWACDELALDHPRPARGFLPSGSWQP